MVKDVSSEVRDALPRHNLPNLAVWWLCPGTASTTGWISPRSAPQLAGDATTFECCSGIRAVSSTQRILD
jgi:hypothetical protein